MSKEGDVFRTPPQGDAGWGENRLLVLSELKHLRREIGELRTLQNESHRDAQNDIKALRETIEDAHGERIRKLEIGVAIANTKLMVIGALGGIGGAGLVEFLIHLASRGQP